jgi:hypothetical protein
MQLKFPEAFHLFYMTASNKILRFIIYPLYKRKIVSVNQYYPLESNLQIRLNDSASGSIYGILLLGQNVHSPYYTWILSGIFCSLYLFWILFNLQKSKILNQMNEVQRNQWNIMPSKNFLKRAIWVSALLWSNIRELDWHISWQFHWTLSLVSEHPSKTHYCLSLSILSKIWTCFIQCTMMTDDWSRDYHQPKFCPFKHSQLLYNVLVCLRISYPNWTWAFCRFPQGHHSKVVHTWPATHVWHIPNASHFTVLQLLWKCVHKSVLIRADTNK